MKTRDDLLAYGRNYRIKNREALRLKDKARYLANREKRLREAKTYYLENRERINARNREYWDNNADKMHKRQREYYLENKATIAVKAAEVQRVRNTNPYNRLVNNLRRRVLLALAGKNKSSATLKLLGCNRLEFRAHLESLFKPGMTWENYGPVWHVDHIKPCAKFNLSDPNQQRMCFHWTNLQPLFAKENLTKGAKYDTSRIHETS